MSTNSKKSSSGSKANERASSGGGKNPEAVGAHPVDYIGLMAAWRADFWNTMGKMLPHISADHKYSLWPANGKSFVELIQKRMALGLEYIIFDAEEFWESKAKIGSFEFGYKCATNLVLEHVLRNHAEASPFQSMGEDSEVTLTRLQACMIALIARGETGRAYELARMTDGLLWINENLVSTRMLHPPYDKIHGRDKQRIKLLLDLAAFIQDGKIPTHKTLRIEVFGGNMDSGNFSRLLKGMEIAKFIPRDSTASKGDKGLTFYEIRRPLDGWPNEKYIKFIASKKIDQSHSENTVDAEPDTAPYCSIRPSGDPEMAQCEIRRIRESLGAAYWQLLIQFGMGELETPEDLQVFVERLASIGLELK